MAKDKKTAMDRPQVDFVSGAGKKVKLVFEKNEYRAYRFNDRYGQWEEMKLGSLDPKVLMDYIIKNC